MPITMPEGDGYRTCDMCGGDAPPEHFDGTGQLRLAFVCPEHGVQSIVYPFEEYRRPHGGA